MSTINIFDSITTSESLSLIKGDVLDIYPVVTNLLTDSMASTPSGTLSGTATYDGSNLWTQLIAAQGSSSGTLQYTDSLLNTRAFIVTFDWYRNGSADGMYFFWGCSTTNAGGYALYLDFFNNRAQLRFNGSTIVTQSPITMPNNAFTAIVIRVTYSTAGNQIDVDINGSHIFSYFDTTRSLPGNLYGWQAVTGGQTSTQRIKNLVIDDVTQTDRVFVDETVTLQKNLTVSVFDQATISEYLDIVAGGARNLPVFDTIEVSEYIDSVSANIRNLVLFDSIEVSEALEDDHIDKVFISEFVKVMLRVRLNVFDLLQVSEFMGYKNYDEVTVSEFIALSFAGPILFINVFDTVTVEAQNILYNLVPNPSFELGTLGYDLDGDFSLSSESAAIGSNAIKQVSTSGFSNFGTHNDINRGWAVTPNTIYVFSFYYKLTVTSGFAPIVYINADSEFGTTLGSHSLVNKTSFFRDSIVFNSGSHSMTYFRLQNNNGTVIGYYDGFQLEVGSTPTSYIDGSITGNEWSGTPHNSISHTIQNSVSIQLINRVLINVVDQMQVSDTVTSIMPPPTLYTPPSWIELPDITTVWIEVQNT